MARHQFDDATLIAEINAVINPETSEATIDEVVRRLAWDTRLDADHAMAGTSLFRQMFGEVEPTTLTGPGLFANPFTETEEYRIWQAKRAVQSVVSTNIPITGEYLSPQRHRTLYSHQKAPLHTTHEFIFNSDFSQFTKPSGGGGGGGGGAADASAEASVARIVTAAQSLHPRYIDGWSVSALNLLLYSNEPASAMSLKQIMEIIGQPLGVVMSTEPLPVSLSFSRSKVALGYMVSMYDYWRYHFGNPKIQVSDAPLIDVRAWWVVRKVVVSDSETEPPRPPPKPSFGAAAATAAAGAGRPSSPPPRPPRPASPPPPSAASAAALDAKHNITGSVVGASAGSAAVAAAAAATAMTPAAKAALLQKKRQYALGRYAYYRGQKIAAAGKSMPPHRAVWRIEPHLTANGDAPSYGLDLKNGEYAQIHVGRISRTKEPVAELPNREATHAALFPRRLAWLQPLLNLPTIDINLNIDPHRPRAAAAFW